MRTSAFFVSALLLVLGCGPSSKVNTFVVCALPKAACASVCVDLTTDVYNCGACGKKCNGTCHGGVCQTAAGCANGLVMCSGTCVNTATDALNCGGCTMACAQGQACQSGVCMGGGCTMGQTSCNGSCVDETSDPANCGACSQACAVGQSCVASNCVTAMCTMGQIMCSGSCVDTTMDIDNCGGCAMPCVGGQTCVASQCSGGNNGCPMPQIQCNGQCTDPTSDPDNCGVCNNVCNMNQTCNNGQCSGQQMMGGLDCGDLVNCVNNCNSDKCVTNCGNMATQQANTLFNNLLTCIFMNACPDSGGGVCDENANNYSDKKCNTCVSNAQDKGGQCAMDANACMNDM